MVPNALAVARDGFAYLAGAPTSVGSDSVFLLNATGTSLVAAAAPGLSAHAIALARDGSLYLAGPTGTGPDPFIVTAGAFQSDPGLAPNANATQTAIVKMDAKLDGILAGTYFGGAFGNDVNAITLDAAGNVYVGGYTSPRSLPTRTPFVQGFGLAVTGYAAELSGNLSDLLFSSEFGDNEAFGVNGLAIGARGNLVLGGLVLGAGFGTDAQLSIGGAAVTTISSSATNLVAIVPWGLAGAAATVQVLSGGGTSNSVLAALVH